MFDVLNSISGLMITKSTASSTKTKILPPIDGKKFFERMPEVLIQLIAHYLSIKSLVTLTMCCKYALRQLLSGYKLHDRIVLSREAKSWMARTGIMHGRNVTFSTVGAEVVGCNVGDSADEEARNVVYCACYSMQGLLLLAHADASISIYDPAIFGGKLGPYTV